MGVAYVITSGKGGVGKTTTTANLGIALAYMGKKVVVVDADTGLRNLDVVMGLENRIVYDLVDVVDKLCELRQALIRDKRFEGLYLLPTAQVKDKTSVRPEQMLSICEKLKKEFEYVLIDCPAGIELGFENAVAGADKAIIVTVPEVTAVRDADRVIGKLESRGMYDNQLIINRLKIDMVRRGDMLGQNDIQRVLSVDLLGVIPEDERIIISTNRGQPVVTDDVSPAGKAYRNVARRLTGDTIPITNFESAENGFKGFMRKLFNFR